MSGQLSSSCEMTPLSGWENFYVIIGSSAGALIGLQFVLITLIADIPVRDVGEQAGQAFATPTVVHFGAALTIAGAGCAPWREIHPIAILWGVLGICGLVYGAIVTRRMQQQGTYRPEFEDWLFHVVLPFVAYGSVAVSAYFARSHFFDASFGVAGATLLLLFIGIHNAWDAATYHVFVVKRRLAHKGEKEPPADSTRNSSS